MSVAVEGATFVPKFRRVKRGWTRMDVEGASHFLAVSRDLRAAAAWEMTNDE